MKEERLEAKKVTPIKSEADRIVGRISSVVERLGISNKGIMEKISAVKQFDMKDGGESCGVPDYNDDFIGVLDRYLDELNLISIDFEASQIHLNKII